MALVTVHINNRPYEIACNDGQQGHVEKLAAIIDRHAQALTRQVGVVPDARLLVMVGLLLADELNEARAEVERTRLASVDTGSLDAALAQGIGVLANRIAAIADRIQKS